MPGGPPQVGLDEVVIDEQGQTFYRAADGTVKRLRAYQLALGQFVQDGTAAKPTPDTWTLNEFGQAGAWAYTSAGVYVYTFEADVVDEDVALVFASITTSAAAKVVRAGFSAADTLDVLTDDEDGAAVEASCTMNLMILGLTGVVT